MTPRGTTRRSNDTRSYALVAPALRVFISDPGLFLAWPGWWYRILMVFDATTADHRHNALPPRPPARLRPACHLAAFLVALSTASPALAEPPPAAVDDCSQTGPVRVPLLLAVGDRQIRLRATLDSTRAWEREALRRREMELKGKSCPAWPVESDATCNGTCTLQVRPGSYGITWGKDQLAGFTVGPTGGKVTLREGNNVVAMAALGVAMLGCGTALITTIPAISKEDALLSWNPYTVTLVASGSAVVVGMATAFIVSSGARLEPYASKGAASIPTLSAAPVPGGALVFGTIRF